MERRVEKNLSFDMTSAPCLPDTGITRMYSNKNAPALSRGEVSDLISATDGKKCPRSAVHTRKKEMEKEWEVSRSLAHLVGRTAVPPTCLAMGDADILSISG